MSVDIKVENLTKVYSISHKSKVPQSMREVIETSIRRAVARVMTRGAKREAEDTDDLREEFRALDDVSFEVKSGERFGVVGQNGAGKSTLLKIISRITEPTSGSVSIRGRVASLLEVGTGFHPELNGRENIFLNGAILGMPQSEIKKKFDEIVAFSEVERFLDTPVKFYSSGMYVRLAFSVAAHLDPEVLILDEVLAVGDLRFQQKCLNRMQYASNEGRTVLFVSHNMQSVLQICPRSVLLDKGRIRAIGPSADVVQKYVGAAFIEEQDANGVQVAVYDTANEEDGDNNSNHGDDHVRLVNALIKNHKGEPSATLQYEEKIILEMEYDVLTTDGTYYVPNFHIYSVENVLAFIASPPDGAVREVAKGRYRASCEIPRCVLNEGIFRVTLAVSSLKEAVVIHVLVPNGLTFRVVDDLVDISYRNGYMHAIPGILRPQLQWNMEKLT